MMKAGRRAIDVAALPSYAFGHHGLIWWGTLGFMVIEASMFVVVLIAYFYLRLKVSEWPPSLPDPDLGFATANILLVFVSLIPAALAKRAAEKLDLPKVHLWLTTLTIFACVSLVLRAFEYTDLNCRWDDNAYASITWLLLSLHTIHLVTDTADSGVLAVLMFTGPVEKSRFVDVAENSLYWYFIVLSWVPIYLTVYFAPRWL